MFDPIISIIGLTIVAVTMVDATITTILLSGAGPISGPVGYVVGRLAMHGSSHISKNASILALLAMFFTWALLLLIGWTLAFCGSESAVVSSTSGQPADLISRVYYAGFTITTLGTGDYVSQGGLWQCLTIIAATTGFFQVTISATYVFNVLTALNERRTLGLAIGMLGDSPSEIVALHAEDTSSLQDELQRMTSAMHSAAIKTDSYPILAYTHVANEKYSFSKAIATLAEVAILMREVVEKESRMPESVLRPLFQSAMRLISGHTKEVLAGKNYDCDIQPLEKSGIPLQADWDHRLQSNSVESIRHQLDAWLRWHNTDWGAIY